MLVDVLIDPFDASWPPVRDLAVAAEEQGYGGVWTWDHLSGVVHDQGHVLEGWTLLSALAAITTRVALGPLVVNQVNRDATVLAQMAATLQEVTGGRLWLGVGAGTGPHGPYAVEQQARGRRPGSDPDRRRALVDYLATIDRTWSGELGGVGGFLVPEPRPPVLVAAFGPKMAELAGRHADGLNTQAGLERLEEVVATARAAAAHPDTFVVTAFATLSPAWLDPDSPGRRRLVDLGCDRLQLVVRPGLDADRLPASGN